MLIRIPHDTNMDYDEHIEWFLTWFQDLYKKPYIQLAYKSGVAGITAHAALMTQFFEKRDYWDVLAAATEKEVISQSFDSLFEVLMDFTIKELISIMFDGFVTKDSNTWTDDTKAYAFGN